MAGKTPRQAVDQFLTPLQRALSCITDAVLQCRVPTRASVHGAANLAPLTRLKAGAETFHLTVELHFRIVEDAGPRGPYRLTTIKYSYSLLDADEKEILAYHWHPDGDVAFPHLHIGCGARAARIELHKAHIPTGRIALEDLLRMAINEFGIEPRRDDWRDVLAKTQAAYEKWRTWPRPEGQE